MNINYIKIIIKIAAFYGLMLFCGGCSTGIEGTKTITYSKSERKEISTSAEEKFASEIKPSLLKDWEEEKKFMISDKRAALVFESSSLTLADSTDIKGREIRFSSISERPTPGGGSQAVIIFTDGNRNYRYPTGKERNDALENISSLDIPMLIDLDIVEQYRKRLEGMEVWTRSQLWYDMNGEKLTGRKFIPVKILKVEPGDMLFQMHLLITDENGKESMLYMNPAHRGLESRTFSNLFSLTDPKLKYPSIEPEVWDYICRGLVKTGMTKEECKLSLGNPDDVSTGHDWNQTIDIWNYKNGVFLQFQDGLLTRFRI